MTLDQRTDSELNRIVAEWMEYVEHDQLNEEGVFEYSYWQNKNGNAVNIFFCSDLNACHLAEEGLELKNGDFTQPDRMKLYREILECLCVGIMGGAMRAPARKRTEALVKVIEEGK